MVKTAEQLRASLRQAGFSQSAIKAAWPEWWSEAAEASTSARNELRFSLARKLGLDPRSLIRDEAPQFVWTDRTKYKRVTAESDFEREALSSYGHGIARAVLSASPSAAHEPKLSALAIRSAILASQPYVRLPELITCCWTFGIPVVYLRVFPLQAKRMSAMSVCVGGRYAILLAQDAKYPAPVAYYVAHELGHIALGHLRDESAIVDLADPLRAKASDLDDEELASDQYALELLTGEPEPHVSTETHSFLAAQLAQAAIASSEELRIEPGTIALCFGHSTGRWNKAYGAMKYIYGQPAPIWRAVNSLAADMLDWSELPTDFAEYLRAVLGL